MRLEIGGDVQSSTRRLGTFRSPAYCNRAMEGYSLKWPVYWKHDASIGAMNIIPTNDVFIPPL
jgi:hypothetical protein